MTRTFISIDLPKEIKDYLFELQKQLAKQISAKIKWTAKKNLHLTLKFLDEITEQQLEQVKNSLKEIKFNTFKTSLNQIGFFPNIKKPNILWLNLHPPKEIIQLQQQIDQETLNISTKQQDFKTHLTLGRIKLLKKPIKPQEIQQPQNKTFQINSFQLMKSTLTKDGPRYTILETYNSN